MSIQEETVRHLKLLGARAEAIADAYASDRGRLNDAEAPPAVIDELVQRRIANRSGMDAEARLSSHLVKHLDVAMNTARIRQLGLDIGAMVDDIRDSTNRYLQIKGVNASDARTFLEMAEDSANALCDSLQEEAADVWGLIQDEFSVVDSLEAKIILNRSRLERTGKLVTALESLDLQELNELAMGDRRLRPLFGIMLPVAVESSRQNLGDALTQLTQMLFQFEQLERRAALVKGFIRHFRQHRDYQPQDYSAQVVVPDLFRTIAPVIARPAADIATNNSRVEIQLAELLDGLRVEQPQGRPGEASDGVLEEGSPEEVEIRPSPLREAVRQVFVDVVEVGE
ncbi:MAG: hypothetical protein WBJ03_09485, partial [Moraxellaceae bacterium]